MLPQFFSQSNASNFLWWCVAKEKRKEKETFLLVKPMLMFQQGIRGPKKLLAELQGERKRKEEKKDMLTFF